MTLILATAIIVRPANTTAYASGDIVANSTTAGSVNALQFNVTSSAKGGTAVIKRARINKTSVGVTSPAFRLHLYSSKPTVTNGDNGVWLSNKGAGYLGSIDVTADRAFSDGAAGASDGLANIIVRMVKPTKAIYGLLEARGAYAPGSAESITVTIEGEFTEAA